MSIVNEIISSITLEVMLTIVAIGIILLVPRVTTFFLKAVAQGAIGAVIMVAFNFALSPLGVFVGVNFITVGVAGLLGLPGVVSLYILQALV